MTVATGNAATDAMIVSAQDSVNRGVQAAASALLALDFLMQLAGTSMAIAGGTTRGTRVDVERRPSTTQWQLAPTVGGAQVRVQF